MTFLCGAAREIMTPPVGTLLYGYRPDLVSTSVHDDLTVSALAVGNGEETALLITATLGDIATSLDAEIRAAVAEATGLDKSNILLSATHTHCGPNTSGVVGWGEIDRPFVDNLFKPATVKAAKDALASMKEAEMGYAVGKSDIGINRRQQNENGGIALGQNPWGTYDPNLTVLIFREKETKKGIYNLIHYGCHGTACGANPEITRDWSGMMIDRVEEQTGTLTAFYNGCIGDVGPRLSNGKTVGNITFVEELGNYAAMEAMKVVREVRAFAPVSFTLKKGTVRLPYQKFPPREQVQAYLATVKEPEKLYNSRLLRYQYYKDVEEKYAAGDLEIPADREFEQTLVILGDTVFIPFPFEMFSEITLRLRAYSGYQNTLGLSCTNGYNAYLPVESELCRGGYEVDVFRFANVYSLADNTDQNIIRENLRILRED